MTLLLLACTGTPIVGDPADTDPSDTAEDTAPAPPSAEALTLALHPEVATVVVATWTQLLPGDTQLAWEIDGVEHRSPLRARAAGPASEVVLGLPSDTAVTITLHAATNDGATTLAAPITTGPLPPELSAPTLRVPDVSADPAPFLLTSVNAGPQNFFGPCFVVILDRTGRVVWYRDTGEDRLTLFPRVAQAGTHILWEATSYYVAGEPSLTRATLSLGQEHALPFPSMGFTWDELPDGSILYDEAETPYDYHLTRHHPDGAEERVWSCAPWMAAHSTDYWACAANTVLYDPATNGVLYSMFQTSTVVAIDLDSGAVVWELGEYPGGLAFDPADIRLELQHYPNVTPDGTLLLTTHVPGAREQHIRELALDGETATQVWHHTAPGYYGDYAGEATRLPNGDTLVNYGTDGVLREVTGDEDVVWELDWADHMMGHVTPLDDLYALDEGW